MHSGCFRPFCGLQQLIGPFVDGVGGVCEMSWSRNWPNCISIWVTLEVARSCGWRFKDTIRGLGSARPVTDRLGTLWSSEYDASRRRSRHSSDLPQRELLRLLQLPSLVRYWLVRQFKDGLGHPGFVESAMSAGDGRLGCCGWWWWWRTLISMSSPSSSVLLVLQKVRWLAQHLNYSKILPLGFIIFLLLYDFKDQILSWWRDLMATNPSRSYSCTTSTMVDVFWRACCISVQRWWNRENWYEN